MDRQAVYAYDFEGNRYDVGDKFGFIKATIDFSLEREDLKQQVRDYILNDVALRFKDSDEVEVDVTTDDTLESLEVTPEEVKTEA